MKPTTQALLADIPSDRAMAAYRGISMTPEKRGEQVRQDYAATLLADFERLALLAGSDQAKIQTLSDAFPRYREGFRRVMLAMLDADSRCLSVMVAGPSNFPGRRNAKRNATADRRRSEMFEYRNRALKAITRSLTPEKAPVMAGDDDAVERLEEKIRLAEARHEQMKQANAVLRKFAKAGPEAQIAALVEVGIEEGRAKLIADPELSGRVGFPSYALQNSNANIRRMKQRLAQVAQSKATPATEIEGETARLEDCPADNRIRLYFPGKPDAETRGRLKAGGFRWAPSVGAWQAYRNPSALIKARQFAGVDDA